MSIEEKKFIKLFKELQFHKSEYELVLEVLKTAHWDFEDFYRNYCIEKDIDLAGLNKQHRERVDTLLPGPISQNYDTDGILEIKAEMVDKTSKKEFKKIYREVVKTLHPDVGGDEKEFKRFSDSFNEMDWCAFLEICQEHKIEIKNYKKVNDILKKEIEKTKEETLKKKDTYSWLLYRCDDSEVCKENVVKKFLKHLFDYGGY